MELYLSYYPTTGVMIVYRRYNKSAWEGVGHTGFTPTMFAAYVRCILDTNIDLTIDVAVGA